MTLTSRAPKETNEERQSVKGILAWRIFLSYWLWSDVNSEKISVTEL